ncbi:MSMEG_0569 family flavin-dependent oxidoreductase [Frankia sp. Ag45/Mut15]|uniref:MSMEG_0569 family flavin-dependent oxidoreductase n=1 Tax=Frankia umida TaxID=573489 RepID=A0ABT0JW98_9ACTN|nr:MSMEG_0569 family flavin-dependent oxidoreductase [Frankia umida]MCK9875819.1 MSMEG_0569 family flavin-dependent oxidoreductase [Frankia umida]
MSEHLPVAIIGGGQAGLALSWHLVAAGVEHAVLERDTAMHTWRDARWDSFCLVTPNWQCQLPGYTYTGPDPDGFMVRAQILDWLDGYRASFAPPLREHTAVTSLRPRGDGPGAEDPAGGFVLRTTTAATSSGGDEHEIVVDQAVVATGGYHVPAIPRLAERLPAGLVGVHSSAYTNPDALPAGPVLVVGTGQSGAQIAEDLHLAGREVHLAVGNAPRFARTYRGRDVIAWMHDTGHYARPVTDRPLAERTQDRTNHYVTGRDGGRDIDLRAFARDGMILHGRLLDLVDGQFHFAGDLGANLDTADEVYNGINGLIDTHIATHGPAVEIGPSRYVPVWHPPSSTGPDLAVDDIAAVVWATGFTRDHRWLHAGVFDGAGHPQHLRGVTAVPGLYFLGLPWLHTWGSGRFAGLAPDAAYLAEHITERIADQHRSRTRTQPPTLAEQPGGREQTGGAEQTGGVICR